MKPTELFVGTVINGFCGGLFGRDFWGPARIEAIGADWVVVRDERGEPWFASDDTRENGWTWRDVLAATTEEEL